MEVCVVKFTMNAPAPRALALCGSARILSLVK
jgi:hypothetical protein